MTLSTETKKAKYRTAVSNETHKRLTELRRGIEQAESVEVKEVDVETNWTAATGSARIRVTIPFTNPPGEVFKYIGELVEHGKWSVCKITPTRVEVRWVRKFGEHKS